MSNKDIRLPIKGEWIGITRLKLPGAMQKIVSFAPIRLSLEVIVPEKIGANGIEKQFDYQKNAALKKFRETVEGKIVDALMLVAEEHEKDQQGDEDAYANADKHLKDLNTYLEKSVAGFRVLLRTAVAKTIGGKVRADDLTTYGSMSFKKIEIVPGAFQNEISFDSPMLDLSKALSRKKWQQCGVAWKADECVISVKSKKDFKEADLKELREFLPEGKDKGAKMLAGRFKADSATKVTFEFPPKKKTPLAKLLRAGMKKQTDQQVHVYKVEGSFQAEDKEKKEKPKEKEKKPEAKNREKKSEDAQKKQKTPEATKKGQQPQKSKSK